MKKYKIHAKNTFHQTWKSRKINLLPGNLVAEEDLHWANEQAYCNDGCRCHNAAHVWVTDLENNEINVIWDKAHINI